MEMSLVWSAAFIVALLALSALFSGSETALTAASRARMYRLAQDGNAGARTAQALLADKERLIGSILLGNNLVNILASSFATSVLIALVGEAGVVYATLGMTVLVLIFAEVLPKTYAISNPDRMAVAVSRPMGLIVAVFSPVVSVVGYVVRQTLRLFGVNLSEGQEVLSVHDEIRGALDLGASEGSIRKAHRDMLGSILDLDEVAVEDVMIHRKSMAMIDLDDGPESIVDTVVDSHFTRLPVYEGDTDNIRGVIHAKDMLRALRKTNDPAAIDIAAIMTPPWFVPETTTLREQLNAFLARHAHVALVVDEYGALQGLVTLEDIIEEIVGEISDEFDPALQGIKVLADGRIQVDGAVTVRDLNRRFDWSLPDETATTIAGLVIYEAETIPIVGETFRFFGFEFEIVARRRNQVTQIRIRKLADEAAE